MKTQKVPLITIFLLITILATACNGIASILPQQSISATPIISDSKESSSQEVSGNNEAETTTDSQQPLNAPLSESGVIAAYEGVLENIYSQVNPSVVNIRVIKKLTESSFSMGDLQENPFSIIPGFPDIPGFPSTPDNEEPNNPQYSQSLGSGFIWDKEGHIITNHHVVDGADKIEVTFYDDTSVVAELVGSDSNSDLAVLKVDLPDGQFHPVVMADSTKIKVGELAIAIGNPYGLEGTMTVGIISALGRSLPVESNTLSSGHYSIPDIIQTDAPINPGNSGGVLVDDKGMVIGVTSAIESTDGSNSGIGFVIPSALVQKIVPSLIETGSYQHPYMGISGISLTADLASAMNLEPTQKGALVQEVVSDSPADKAGIKGSARKVTIDGQEINVGGDVIVGIDNEPITSMDEIIAYLTNNTEVGQKVKLTILRDGKEMMIDVTLDARPTEQASASQKVSNNGVWLGISGIPLTSEIANALDLPDDQTGILIQEVEANSPADKAGLQGGYKPITIQGERIMLGGDVILAIDGEDVTSIGDITQLLANYHADETVELSIIRGGEKLEIPVTLEQRP